jgi:hypothetical protein
VELDDPAEGFGMREVGPDYPEYATWLACSEERADARRPARAPGDDE